MKQLIHLSKLAHLNVGNTNISGHGAISLKCLTQIKALHIGSTKIKGTYIQELSKELKWLKKLSLKGLGVTDNVSGRGTLNSKQLQQISLNMQYLTHLDLGGCSTVDDSAFDYFYNLKFVNVWMANGISKLKRNELMHKNVVVI